MAIEDHGHLAALREAFHSGRLTFYLGAGVSVGSGIPSWEELVQALYFYTLNEESFIYELKPYPNYLFALAEWVMKQKKEPLEIITRKIKQWYEGRDFLKILTEILYAGLARDTFGPDIIGLPEHIREQNKTLGSVIDCAIKSNPGHSGLRSIINYNLDSLLELGFECCPDQKDNFQVISKEDQLLMRNKIPIYHVHGYIPYNGPSGQNEDVIFSEEQYNRIFQNPNYWGNVVQVNQMTSGPGLMIGLSLSDRNIRRILDSIRNQPLPRENYILMKKPQFALFDDQGPEFDLIHKKAREYLQRFPQSRMKMSDKEPRQIRQLLEKIYHYEDNEFEKGFESLGLHLITIDEFDEIPKVLERISN
jgi:hypothetical protein